jgi:hypothetical protein
MQGPLALVAALAGALAFAALAAHAAPGRRRAAELALFAACGGNALPTLLRAEPLAPREQAQATASLAPAAIRDRQIPATVVDEYLPRGAQRAAARSQRPAPGLGPVVRAPQDARVTVLDDRGTRIALDVALAEPARLRIARWSVPGWSLALDGRPAQPLANEVGSLDVELPAGETRMSLRLDPPWPRRAGLALSAAALLVWLRLATRRGD